MCGMPYWVRLISAKYRPPPGSTVLLFSWAVRVTACDGLTGSGSAAVTVITPIAATADTASRTWARLAWPVWLRRSRRNSSFMALPSSRCQCRRGLQHRGPQHRDLQHRDLQDRDLQDRGPQHRVARSTAWPAAP